MLKDIAVGANEAPLEKKRKAVVDHAKAKDRKYANMLRHLDLLVFKNIANNLNCGSSNDVYLFSFKAHSKKYIDTIGIF